MAQSLKVRLITKTHTHTRNKIKSGVITHSSDSSAVEVGGFKASFRLHNDFKFSRAQINKTK